MARLRYNGLTATLGAAMDATQTSITFAAALAHSGTTAVPTISGGDYIPLTILTSSDPDSAVSEVVYLTAYTSGATTGTITRAQESTTAAAHAAGVYVVNAATALDFSLSAGETTWTAPTLENSWANFGSTYANAGYRKDAFGVVHLRGMIKNGTLGSAAFTLPAGYRPPADIIVAVISNDAFGEVIITSAGAVKPTTPSSTNWVSLSGITFFVD